MTPIKLQISKVQAKILCSSFQFVSRVLPTFDAHVPVRASALPVPACFRNYCVCAFAPVCGILLRGNACYFLPLHTF
jgi:hypothetical protein